MQRGMVTARHKFTSLDGWMKTKFSDGVVAVFAVIARLRSGRGNPDNKTAVSSL